MDSILIPDPSGGSWIVIQGCPLKEKHELALDTPQSGPCFNTCRFCEHQIGTVPRDIDWPEDMRFTEPRRLVCGILALRE